ncbi:MAG: hypothetical protein ACP5F0_04265 [Sulfurihydrogenibium sp.]
MLSDKFLENLSKKKNVIVPDTVIIDNYIQHYGLTAGTVGAGKISDRKLNLRIIEKPKIYRIEDNITYAYSDLAKLFLYKALDSIGWKKFRNLRNEQLSIQGLYCRSGNYNDYPYVYIDITDNHYNVYKYFLFSIYSREHFLLSNPNQTILTGLDIPKPVKRFIYGIMRSRRFTIYRVKGSKVEFDIVEKYHNLFNPDIANLINDLSRSICYYAVKHFQAVYCNTDGYIIPWRYANDFISFLKELGFNSKVKNIGFVEIKGIGVYRFYDIDKEDKTLNYDRIKAFKDYSNILDSEERLYIWLVNKYKELIKQVI